MVSERAEAREGRQLGTRPPPRYRQARHDRGSGAARSNMEGLLCAAFLGAKSTGRNGRVAEPELVAQPRESSGR